MLQFRGDKRGDKAAVRTLQDTLKSLTHFAYAAAFCLCLAALLTAPMGIINADTLWMEDYLRALFSGQNMRTWQPAMAPNYFPDMFIYAAARLTTDTVGLAL